MARDVPSLARERALKESRKFRARFSFALSFLLVMAMGDFSSPGVSTFKRNQVALNDWTTSALG